MEERQIFASLSEIKSKYGLTISALASAMDCQERTLRDYLAGRSEPKFSSIQKLLKSFPSLSAEWLLRGNGSMLITESATSSQNESDSIYYTRLAQIRQKRIEELEEQLARLQAV